MKNNTIAHALCKILENESELSLNIPSLSFYGNINTDGLHVTDNGFVQGGDLSITDASAFSVKVLLSDEIEGTVLRLSLGEDVSFDLYNYEYLTPLLYWVLALRERWIITGSNGLHVALRDFRMSQNLDKIVSDVVTLEAVENFSAWEHGENITIMVNNNLKLESV